MAHFRDRKKPQILFLNTVKLFNKITLKTMRSKESFRLILKLNKSNNSIKKILAYQS